MDRVRDDFGDPRGSGTHEGNDLIVEMKQRLSVTSIAFTHDMQSAYKIGDRIAMLYDGVIIETGTPKEIQSTGNPIVRQFITGSAAGPIKIEGVSEVRQTPERHEGASR